MRGLKESPFSHHLYVCKKEDIMILGDDECIKLRYVVTLQLDFGASGKS